MNEDQIRPSQEVVLEQIRRSAAAAPAYDLDEQLAVAIARRDVAAAHGYQSSAERWNDFAIMLADIRHNRADHQREVDELTGPPPPITRPLTPEELAEGDQ